MGNWLFLMGCWTQMIHTVPVPQTSKPRSNAETKELVLRGWLHLAQSNCSQAFQTFDEAIQSNPQDPWLHRSYGYLAQDCKDFPKAIHQESIHGGLSSDLRRLTLLCRISCEARYAAKSRLRRPEIRITCRKINHIQSTEPALPASRLSTLVCNISLMANELKKASTLEATF